MQPLKIGNVIRVESGHIDVLLTVKDLNLVHDEQTYRVGQLGTYITIPMDNRTLVGFVVGCVAAGPEDLQALRSRQNTVDRRQRQTVLRPTVFCLLSAVFSICSLTASRRRTPHCSSAIRG